MPNPLCEPSGTRHKRMIAPKAPLPTTNQKRVDLLDIFRGFAVFGIFVVNIEIMNCTFFNQGTFSGQWTSTIDQASVRILQLFFYSKFFPIFSFLFGLGISMQALKRFENNKTKSSAFFVRRMVLLFIIGILHIILLWSGDVLHLYALLGLLTLLLLKVPNRWLLISSVGLLLFPFYDQVAELAFTFVNFNPGSFLEGYSSQEITRVIRSGTYVEGVKLRVLEYASNVPVLFVFLAPVALSMFLLGLYFGKKKLVYSIDSLVDKIKKPVIAVAVLTNVYRVLFLFVLPDLDVYSNEALRPVFFKLMFLSDVAMGLFYLWLIAWVIRFPKWRRVLSPLKYVGRMALTNYLMHSFIGLLLFSSIGLQFYETLSPAATLLTATAVFCLQLVFSKVWLTYFYYGPLEWMWRCFSYQKLLPLRKRFLPGNVGAFGRR